MPRIEHSKRDQYLNSLLKARYKDFIDFSDNTDQQTKHMQIAPFEGNMISLYLRMIGATKVLEIGSLNGYSASWILSSLPDSGHLDCIEKSQDSIMRSKQNIDKFGFKASYAFHQGDAKEILLSLEGPYDAIFIDSDKASYGVYLDYAKSAVKRGGLIMIDNIFLFGNVYDEPVTPSKPDTIALLQRINQEMVADTQFATSIIPTNEGLLLALKV
ncbi:MAG: O-methyltransferase [Alphaproteobacteria bacterium]|jgi:predicted O-methyltransferase YrrM|nr:class I SAM-dependent methyltransferase [Candidatus Jidaibacter sp.]